MIILSWKSRTHEYSTTQTHAKWTFNFTLAYQTGENKSIETLHILLFIKLSFLYCLISNPHKLLHLLNQCNAKAHSGRKDVQLRHLVLFFPISKHDYITERSLFKIKSAKCHNYWECVFSLRKPSVRVCVGDEKNNSGVLIVLRLVKCAADKYKHWIFCAKANSTRTDGTAPEGVRACVCLSVWLLPLLNLQNHHLSAMKAQFLKTCSTILQCNRQNKLQRMQTIQFEFY